MESDIFQSDYICSKPELKGNKLQAKNKDELKILKPKRFGEEEKVEAG